MLAPPATSRNARLLPLWSRKLGAGGAGMARCRGGGRIRDVTGDGAKMAAGEGIRWRRSFPNLLQRSHPQSGPAQASIIKGSITLRQPSLVVSPSFYHSLFLSLFLLPSRSIGLVLLSPHASIVMAGLCVFAQTETVKNKHEK